MIFKKSVKISIISPSYNQGAFIENAIKSVMNQGFDNFEHIIVDGGSTDNTIDILNQYPHLKWISEKDNGQSDAINKGFNLASGDIIGWLNTDEYYLEGTFDKIIKVLDNNKIDAVYGDIYFVDKNNKISQLKKSIVPIKWMSLFYCYIPSASFFFKRNIIDNGIRIDNNMHICMDKDFFANIMYENYEFKYIPSVLTAFTWHDNNKSIDTKEIKKIRREEGLKIFNKYAFVRLPVNSITISIYTLLMLVFTPIKKALKLYNYTRSF